MFTRLAIHVVNVVLIILPYKDEPFRYVGDRWGPKYVEIQSKTFVTVAIRKGQSVSLKDILILRVVLIFSRTQVDYLNQL